MKLSVKMGLVIILKVTKNQGLTLCLEDIFFEKPQWRGGGRGTEKVKLTPSRFRVKGEIKSIFHHF